MNCIIIKDGKSEYSLLLSKNATSLEKKASDIFSKYIEESTGVTLPVVTEGENAVSKFVSVGNTDAFKKQNFDIRHGKSGFTVTEKDGNLYLFGQGVSGAIWAVYGFIEKALNYKFYTNDEYSVDKKQVIDASGYDYFYTPTIEHRSSAFGYCRLDLEYATNLKAYGGFGTYADGTYFWGTWNPELSCHNHLTILPLKTYGDAHPEWFNAKKNQLCLNNMEMRDEFFKNLIEYFHKYPTSTHFLLGHEDAGDMCYCENCMKRISQVGTGGLHMEFTNDMARRTEKWRKENCPEREINIGMFAYTTGVSMTPPVKEENGQIVPIADSVVAESNVFVLFAPIGMKDHCKPITAPENKYYYRCFKYWHKVCKRFGVWLYYGSFRRSFEFCDGIYIFKENIRALKEIGCEYFFYESNNGIGAQVFQKMLLYLVTSLEWDVTKDTDQLIDEFMGAYYKCAAPYMREFLDYLMAYYKKARARTEKLTGKKFYYGMCHRDSEPDGFWSLNAVYDMIMILEEAEKSVDESDYSEELKAKIKDRIELEKLFTQYIQLEYFVREISPYDEARSINFFPKEKAKELLKSFIEGCKKHNVTRIDGDCTVDQANEKWSREINWTARAWEDNITKALKRNDELWEKDAISSTKVDGDPNIMQ
ncbi:MAG: DUF4838 domain-containing protein [Clostridia bacterium]|nr:DUF4838 domain-containing protein [Clostridia bacterium]